MRRSYERFRFHINVLACFLAFITIFFITFAFVYYRTTADMKNNAIGESLSHMQRGAGEIGNSFLRAYSDLATIQNNDEFSALARKNIGRLEPPSYGQLLKLQQRLDEICALDDIITDVMIFFDSGDGFAVSPLYVLHDMRNTYENGQFQCGDLICDEFIALIRQYANSYVNINTFTPAYVFGSKLPAIASTPVGSKIMFIYKFNIAYKKCDTYGIVFLDTEAIYEKLSMDGKSLFAITNGSEILYTIDGSAEIPVLMDEDTFYDKEDRTTWIRTASSKTAIDYYTAINDQEILGQIGSFTMLLHILLTVFVLLSVTVLVLLALYVVQPMQNLFNRFCIPRFSDSKVRGNVIRHIFREIDAISDSNLRINTKLSHWTPILKTNLLERLLRDEYFGEDEKEILLSILGTSCVHGVWQVAVIGKILERNSEDGGDTLQRMIGRCLPEAISLSLANDRVAVLSCISPADPISVKSPACTLEEPCGRILDELNRENDVWAVGIGNSCVELFNIHHSFQEAERAFRETKLWRNPSVLHYRRIKKYSSNYTVSYGDINKLYDHLVNGDSGQAYALLVSMADRSIRNTQQDGQSYYNMKQFYHEVLGVLMRIAAHRDLSPVLGSLMEYPEDLCPDALLARFRQAFEFITETFRGDQHTPIRVLYMAMAKFVDDHYDDRDLSLKMLSREFSLSESYLSLCFKNEAGINFSSYLENLRLSRAEKMLFETDMPIKKIARCVGYSTSNTFYKAFKRKHAMTPSQWVEMRRHDEAVSKSIPRAGIPVGS